jgi:hypothetical protein
LGDFWATFWVIFGWFLDDVGRFFFTKHIRSPWRDKNWMRIAHSHSLFAASTINKHSHRVQLSVVNGVARFFLVQNTKTGKNVPNYHELFQMPINITKNRKMDQVSIKYTNIFQYKTLPNLPKFRFLVWKRNHLATLVVNTCRGEGTTSFCAILYAKAYLH